MQGRRTRRAKQASAAGGGDEARYYRWLVEHTSDIITLIGEDGTIKYESPSVKRLLGWDPEEMIGRLAWEFVHPDDLDAVVELFERALGTPGLERAALLRFLRRDGSWRYLEAVGRNQLHDPELSAIIVNSRDVTERVEAEAARRESEERYRSLVEQARDIIYTHDLEGRFTSINAACAAVTGYTAAEVLRMTVADVVAPEYVDVARSMIRGKLAGRASTAYEMELVCRDGSRVAVEIVSWLLRRDGAPLSVQGIARDVTERHRAEAERGRLRATIERSAREWLLTLDAVPMLIVLLERDGRVARLNRPALELAGGLEYADMIGRDLSSLGAGEPWASAAELARESVAAGRAASKQVGGGLGRQWDVSANLLAEEGVEERVIVVARDVTELAELRDTVRRNEGMAALGAVVAGVAHDARNPLFTMSATLDTFEEEFGGRIEGLEQYLGILRRQAGRLARLTEELLEIGRPQRLEPAAVDLLDVVARAVEECAPVAGARGVRLVARSSGPAPVLVDFGRLVRAVFNLLENAVQHAPAGTDVTVSVSEEAGDEQEWVECRVADDGPGFAEDDVESVFEPFFSRRGGGTGLGLSIVERTARLHGGTVAARNREMGGAELVLQLPRGVRR